MQLTLEDQGTFVRHFVTYKWVKTLLLQEPFYKNVKAEIGQNFPSWDFVKNVFILSSFL